jgi:hypothetical protein
MARAKKSASWWKTLPGILTASAGVITALTGLVVAILQHGKPEARDAPEPAAHTTPVSVPPAPHQATAAENSKTSAPEISKAWTDTEAVLTTKNGETVVIKAGTLRYCISVGQSISLDNGQDVEFEQMKSIEVLDANPASVTLLITLLNGKTLQGTKSGNCDIFGYTDVGRFSAYFPQLKRVDFRR